MKAGVLFLKPKAKRQIGVSKYETTKPKRFFEFVLNLALDLRVSSWLPWRY